MARKADFEKLYAKLQAETGVPFQALEPSGRGGIATAHDYIFACAHLQEYNKIRAMVPTPKTLAELRSFLPKAVVFRLKGHSPMLASQYDGLKPEEQKKLFESPSWRFTEKMNGIRTFLSCIDGTVSIISRNYAVDCSIPEYAENVYMPGVQTNKNFVLDCELTIQTIEGVKEQLLEYGLEASSPLEVTSALLQMRSSQSIKIQKDFFDKNGVPLLVFNMIHPLMVSGTELLNHEFGKIWPKYDQIIKAVNSLGFYVKPIRSCNGTRAEKEAFLSQIIDQEGGEGVVAHNAASTYIMSENRSKQGFIKIKRSVGAQADKLGMGDTIDGWISGYDLGSEGTSNETLVSSLHISIFLEENGKQTEHVVAKVPNIPLTIKQQMTEVVNGVPQLKKDYYGMVVAVSGQSISNVSMRLTHPRIIQLPVHHKQQVDCVYDKDFILSQMNVF